MKAKALLCIMTAVFLCLSISCSDGHEAEEDAAEDMTVDEATGDPSAEDAQADDAPSDDGQSEDGPSPQGPLDFVVRNTSSSVVYLDWTYAGNMVIEGARTTGGAWEPLYYLQPSSCWLVSCEGVDPESPTACLVPPCGIMFAVRELGPGQEVVVSWNGEHVYREDAEYCEHGCYWPEEVGPMQYRVTVCTYDSFTCTFDPPCGPSDDGIYEVAQVDEGTAQCFDMDFTVPCDDSEIVIEVE
jgi:hypothetical protein